MSNDSGVVFPVVGGMTGAGISANLGGIGLVGAFGGASVGVVGLTGIGIVTGSAVYGALKGLQEDDPAAWLAFGTGSLGGVGIWANLGGIGVGVKGIAFGFGAGSMAIAGGIAGLGAYGFYKLLARSSSENRFYENLEFFDRITREYEEELFWRELAGEETDIEGEFATLQEEIATAAENPNDSTEIAMTDKLSWQCWNLLKGHNASVNAVAIYPDGETIATAGDDRSIKLWNVGTGKCVYSFAGISEEIRAIAISADGKSIVAGGFDRRISYWSLESKKYTSGFFARSSSPHSHDSVISAVAFSPDGRFIVSASADKTLRVWGKYTGELKRILNGHLDSVNTVAISPDSQIIASGSDDRTIRLWTFDNSYRHRVFEGHTAGVTGVVFTSDGKYIISADRDRSIRIRDTNTGESIKSWVGHDRGILGLAIHPIKDLLASACDREIKLWDLRSGEPIKTLLGTAPIVFSPDGRFLVSGSYGNTVKIWCEMVDTSEEFFLDSFLDSEDWWDILGVSKNATPPEVKRIYRSLARQYHPDINRSKKAIVIMQKINRAYENFLRYISLQ